MLDDAFKLIESLRAELFKSCAEAQKALGEKEKAESECIHSKLKLDQMQARLDSHFDMGGGDSAAVGTNALARDALASSSGMLVPLQSGRTVGVKRAGRQSAVKLMCNTVAHVEECCIASAKKKY